MNNETLATELLRELKAQSRRWFVAFIVVLVLWFSTIGIFIWYVSLPTDEYEITQEANENQNSRTMQIIEGDYNGDETDN